jgi:hypothetical protein
MRSVKAIPRYRLKQGQGDRRLGLHFFIFAANAGRLIQAPFRRRAVYPCSMDRPLLNRCAAGALMPAITLRDDGFR